MNEALRKRAGKRGIYLVAAFLLVGFMPAVQAQILTVLPDHPVLHDLDFTPYIQHSASNLTVYYDYDNQLEEDEEGGVIVRWTGPDWSPRDLSGFTQFVFGVKGDPERIDVRFEDSGVGEVVVSTPFVVGSEFQYWLIDADELDGVDMSNINAIVFYTLGTYDGVEGEGEFTLYVDGLGDPPEISVSPVDPVMAKITTLPGDPILNDIAGSLLEPYSPTNFGVFYNIGIGEAWGGASAVWEDEPVDLTSITQFVFGVTGEPNAIQVEFDYEEGGQTFKTTFILTGVTDELQYWIIDSDDIVGLDEIKAISFVVNKALVHGTYYEGEFHVHVGGIVFGDPPHRLEPVDPSVAELTILPGDPGLRDIAGSDWFVHSATNFSVDYDVSGSPGYGGASVRWEGAATDLTSITQFVFGVKGDPGSVKVEFDYFVWEVRMKTIFILQGVTHELQYWVIDADLIDGLDEITDISFVVDSVLAGGGNHVGSFEVHVGGLDEEEPVEIDPIEPVDPGDAQLTILPNRPDVQDLGGTEYEQHSSTNFSVFYSLGEGNTWDGAMLRWGEEFVIQDLTAYAQFVFGVVGDPEAIRVEFEDENLNETTLVLTGITNELQYWVIDTSVINNLDKIRVIKFVVDEDLAGANVEGQYTVSVGGLRPLPIDVAAVDPSEADITMLPGDPVARDVGGALYENYSSTNMAVLYDLGTGLPYGGLSAFWGGKAVDLTSITQFVFGVKGDPGAILVEFDYEVDEQTFKTAFMLNGVTEELQYWVINSDMIEGLEEITAISFVVNQGLVNGGNGYEGEFHIHVGGIVFGEPPRDVDPVDPSMATLTLLPGDPGLRDIAGSIWFLHSSTNFSVNYDVSGAPGYGGASVRWEGAATDLTSITQFVFGVKGDPGSIKVEFDYFVWESRMKTIFVLKDVTDELQYWVIDADWIAGLDEITDISFVVDSVLAGSGNHVGSFEVHVGLEEDDDPPVVDDPEFNSFTLKPGQVPSVVILDSVVGYDYVLQYTTNLTAVPVNWDNEAARVPGNGNEIVLDDDAELTDEMRIYRVIVIAQ